MKLLLEDIRDDSPPAYYYEGTYEGRSLRLPRTQQAEAIAERLMRYLEADPRYSAEGKMYGVLLAESVGGEPCVIKAFSGSLLGEGEVEGWAPMIPGREEVRDEENRVLALLASRKQQLIDLQMTEERRVLQSLTDSFGERLQTLDALHQQKKEERLKQRQEAQSSLAGDALSLLIEELDQQSRMEGIARRRLKQERDEALRPLQQKIQEAEQRSLTIKRERAEISRQLQAKMHEHYRLTNFAGESIPLLQLMPNGVMRTGTGECCAPKLLHYAASQQLTPLAMAEFWWGPSVGERRQGELYGACEERCQPLMGFLLSGAFARRAQPPLTTLYQDESIIAINKPAGLLSVPGRYHDNQDSVLSRLRLSLPDGSSLMAAHRLDQDTSGILLIARNEAAYQSLQQQFESRSVYKEYEALLAAGELSLDEGVIDLPLWGDPENRPYQRVDHERGKPSVTRFRVLSRSGGLTRVSFFPETGRTHQLRVHAATGLGLPIRGDRLYGEAAERLYLHAKVLQLTHPSSGERLRFLAETPFGPH